MREADGVAMRARWRNVFARLSALGQSPAAMNSRRRWFGDGTGSGERSWTLLRGARNYLLALAKVLRERILRPLNLP